tara:strand:- start:1236 stop:1439 length:204 start_codon:yes stop_codon:yes gene_type:complete
MTNNKKNSVINTIKSVGAAFIGVQSDKKREQDFQQGKLSHFIIVGIAGVVVFISVLIVLVSLVIPNS